MRRSVDFPFGARVVPGGTTCFRLWAPAAASVDLLIEGGGRAAHPMDKLEGGWFALERADAPPGTLYRYRADGGFAFPDPASRAQPEGVHGPSMVVDPSAFEWPDDGWRGRPWAEAVISEIHVGTFSPEGTFDGILARLDHFVSTGINTIELMPIASFPGKRDWGYDGVHLFAPSHVYGRPEDLKKLVAGAHARGISVLLDVVYNHFGPEGNYLGLHAPGFFTERFETPWGAAIDFNVASAAPVRDFMAWNAAYWIGEYGFDGLRLDAVHAIFDHPDADGVHVLEEIAAFARGAADGRQIHLVLENDDNAAWPLDPLGTSGRPRYDAQWNDDFHHAAHVLATGETGGYYSDYAHRPVVHFARALAEGFAYQGEASRHRAGSPRGAPSGHLPPAAFVAFLQNHDQIGNRPLGERIEALATPEAVEALLAVLLLAPSVPMLFMGEEWGTRTPFPFFCDFGTDLAEAVRRGRREEFASFPAFSASDLPDPQAASTFAAARLDWDEPVHPPFSGRLRFVRELLALRRRHIAPLAAGSGGHAGSFEMIGPTAIDVHWRFPGGILRLGANLGPAAGPAPFLDGGEVIYAHQGALAGDVMPPWSVGWVHLPGAAE